MRRHTTIGRALVALSLSALASALVATPARAGGPLLTTSNGTPVRWNHGPVSGGPLNSQTVDAQGRVLYRVDSGTLGSLSNQQAVALVDRIFGLYNSVPTSTIRFVDAGPIRDPRTGDPIDINGNNAGLVLGNSPTFQNPIVFDTDGDITGGGGVLGFFTFLQFGNDDSLEEGTVVLNGATIASAGGPIPFGGVFTHEFGHFAGPLDHEQSNGNIATHGTGSVLPTGFNEAQAYDLYAPFTETLFPFLFDAPFGSQLANGGFSSSGYFVATLDMDTRNALSNLYPTPGYRATDLGSPNGAISGKVVIHTTDGDIPLTGVNVVARRISESSYPPSIGTSAFPNNQVDLDNTGVPLVPPARTATDPLATVESVVTGLADPAGEYTLDGLPPGDYLVEIQQINPFALGGSGIGPLSQQLPLPVVEAYNGANESGASTDNPSDFVPVTVTAGSVTPNIDILLNGFPTTALTRADEREPNEKVKKAQRLSLPLLVSGHTSTNDKFRTAIEFSDGSLGTIQDFYQIETDRDITIFVSLDGATDVGDLDLYLLTGKIGKRIRTSDDQLLAASISSTTHEFIAVHIPPGKFYIGVSAFDGSLDYTLRVLVTS